MMAPIVPCPPSLRDAAVRELGVRLAALRAEAVACQRRALEVGLADVAEVTEALGGRVEVAIATFEEEARHG